MSSQWRWISSSGAFLTSFWFYNLTSPTQMNPDVSGPGVRISFYLQAFFLCTFLCLWVLYCSEHHVLAVLAARSDSKEEINTALYTLTLTNVAMAVTTLVLGFQPNPGMSFQESVSSSLSY